MSDLRNRLMATAADYAQQRGRSLMRFLGDVDIHGFAVPILVDFDDTRQIVEMTVVFPPCILDFGCQGLRRSGNIRFGNY